MIISAENRAKIDEFKACEGKKILVITGKRGSGKSHLARLVFKEIGADEVPASPGLNSVNIFSKFIFLDNISKRSLKDPRIASVTASDSIRSAGQVKTCIVGQRNIILTTNEELPGDIARRAIVINLP